MELILTSKKSMRAKALLNLAVAVIVHTTSVAS